MKSDNKYKEEDYVRVPESNDCDGCAFSGITESCPEWTGKCAEDEVIFIKTPPTDFHPVNKPAGYNQGNIEVIDFLEDQKLDFRAANVVKYVVRYPHKNGLEDLKKARWYLERLIKEEEAEKRSE